MPARGLSFPRGAGVDVALGCPADARVPWHRLRRLALSTDACARKQAALAAHVTQLTPRSASVGAVLGPHLLARAAWRHEYFFV